MAKTETREIKYVCTQCQAEDKVRLYPTEQTPQAVNCWRCKAGFQRPLDEMIANGVGMFPVELVAEEVTA